MDRWTIHSEPFFATLLYDPRVQCPLQCATLGEGGGVGQDAHVSTKECN